MGVPLEVSKTDSTIVIYWNALTGNSEITAYNIYWDTAPSTTGMQELMSDTLVT